MCWVHKRYDKKSQNPKNYFEDSFLQVRKAREARFRNKADRKKREEHPLDNARKNSSSWTGRSCIAFITKQDTSTCLDLPKTPRLGNRVFSRMSANLSFTIPLRIEPSWICILWQNCNTSWKACEELCQGASNLCSYTAHKHTSEGSHQHASSQAFFSPFKLSFSKVFGWLAEGDLHSSIPVSLGPTHPVRKQHGSCFDQCCLCTWLQVLIFGSHLGNIIAARSRDTVLENKSTSFLSAGICGELYQGYVYSRSNLPISCLNKIFLRSTYSALLVHLKKSYRKGKKKSYWKSRFQKWNRTLVTHHNHCKNKQNHKVFSSTLPSAAFHLPKTTLPVAQTGPNASPSHPEILVNFLIAPRYKFVSDFSSLRKRPETPCLKNHPRVEKQSSPTWLLYYIYLL